ncbi:MAG: TetR/AcrR family transcriptional regulator [Pseudomonadota bacterium]
MARKRKTDHESAVASALDLFWSEGYSGASTREIEEKTGLTRFTLQTSYGGKEGFFLETLDAYLDRAEASAFPDPDSTDLGSLAEWFESLVVPGRIPSIDQKGCLAFNSIAEFDRANDAVNARIERYLTLFEERVSEILVNARADGDPLSRLAPDDAAKILVDLLLGLHVAIKARSNDDFAMGHARSIAVLIRSWMRQD